MVRALGFSNGPFSPFKPGRLCRGRERWIEAWEADGPEEAAVQVHRLVITGAQFTDLSAADAVRGLPHSGVDPTSVIAALFPRREMLAFMEDGHPADIPDDSHGIELYDGHRAGGRSEEALVRWYKRAKGVKEIRALLGEPGEDRLRGLAVLYPDTDQETLFEALFPLVGMATLDSPPARFQPAALPEIVKHVRALILVHRDKNGLVLGIYSDEPIDVGTKLATLCTKAESLLVPFAIPPMLARWDRALSELRDEWTEETPFPVPEPEGGYSWENRRRRRRSRKDKTPKVEEAAQDHPPADATPADTEAEAPVPEAGTEPAPDVEALPDEDELLLVVEPASDGTESSD